MMMLQKGAGRQLPRVVLASASPRRRELLRYLDVDFESQTSAVDELERPGEAPDLFVLRLAREKAEEVARRLGDIQRRTVVLGADTTVGRSYAASALRRDRCARRGRNS